MQEEVRAVKDLIRRGKIVKNDMGNSYIHTSIIID
jgi:hypothetical protein